MNNPPSFHFPTWPCGRTPLGLTTKNEGPCCFLVGPPTGSAFPLLHLVGGLPAEYRASYKFYLKSDGRGRKAFFLFTFISRRNPPISVEINQMITNRRIRCRFLGCAFFPSSNVISPPCLMNLKLKCNLCIRFRTWNSTGHFTCAWEVAFPHFRKSYFCSRRVYKHFFFLLGNCIHECSVLSKHVTLRFLD